MHKLTNGACTNVCYHGLTNTEQKLKVKLGNRRFVDGIRLERLV